MDLTLGKKVRDGQMGNLLLGLQTNKGNTGNNMLTLTRTIM
jgi:hypothetical protein